MPKHRSAGGESSFAMIRHIKRDENGSLFHDIEHPRKRAFLAAFSETGSIIRASAKAGIDRHNHSLWMGKDQIYAAAFDLAKEIACDTLESEAVRRAVEGVAEPVFYRGEECGEIRRYSDKLLMFLLKGVAPEKYREQRKGEILRPRNGPVAIEATAQAHALADLFSPDALEAARHKLLAGAAVATDDGNTRSNHS